MHRAKDLRLASTGQTVRRWGCLKTPGHKTIGGPLKHPVDDKGKGDPDLLKTTHTFSHTKEHGYNPSTT